MGATPSKSATEEPATIVIAGGGIVGLVLAMSLKKQLGHDVRAEVYEKTKTFATEAGTYERACFFGLDLCATTA